MSPGYFWLLTAIVLEVISTSALKYVDGLSKPVPLVIVVIGYAASFYMLSLALKHIPIGIAYAIWSGAGILAISVIGWIFFRQSLDAAACIGIGMILIGVLTINLFSNSTI